MPNSLDEPRERVRAAFCEIFPQTPFDESLSMDNFAEWTSVRHVQLLSAIEKLFDLEFDPTQVARLRSVRSLLEFLELEVGRRGA
jgi:acyl carrier protein